MASGGRHLARRNAVQALYQWVVTGQEASSIRSSFIFDGRLEGRYLDYFLLLIKEIPANCDEIDAQIRTKISRDLSAIDPLELSILRVGVYELGFQQDIPPNVVVNEGIEIAKLFCSDNGFKFVNGVLDGILKERQKPAQANEA